MKKFVLIIESSPGRYKIFPDSYDDDKYATSVAEKLCSSKENVFVAEIVAKCIGSLKRIPCSAV